MFVKLQVFSVEVAKKKFAHNKIFARLHWYQQYGTCAFCGSVIMYQ